MIDLRSRDRFTIEWVWLDGRGGTCVNWRPRETARFVLQDWAGITGTEVRFGLRHMYTYSTYKVSSFGIDLRMLKIVVMSLCPTKLCYPQSGDNFNRNSIFFLVYFSTTNPGVSICGSITTCLLTTVPAYPNHSSVIYCWIGKSKAQFEIEEIIFVLVEYRVRRYLFLSDPSDSKHSLRYCKQVAWTRMSLVKLESYDSCCRKADWANESQLAPIVHFSSQTNS